MANIFGNPELTNELKATQTTLDTDNALRIKTSNSKALFCEMADGQDVFTVDTSGTTGVVTIQGDLNVLGATTTITSTNTAIVDPNILLGSGNSSNLVDLGWHGTFNDGTQKYCGLFRDASDSANFKLYDGLTVNPITNVIDTADVSFALAPIQVSKLGIGGDPGASYNFASYGFYNKFQNNTGGCDLQVNAAAGANDSSLSFYRGGTRLWGIGSNCTTENLSITNNTTSIITITQAGSAVLNGSLSFGDTALSKYKVATHAAIISAASNAVSSDTALTLKYTIVGNTVTLDIPLVNASADATGGQAMSITGIPAEITPASYKYFLPTRSDNNGTFTTMGLQVSNSSVITFYQDGMSLAASWASTGSIGWENFSVSYTLA